MVLKSLTRRFTRRVSAQQAPDTSNRCQLPSEAPGEGYRLIGSAGSWDSYNSEIFHVEDEDDHKRTANLPHTLITSDLGIMGRTYRLSFSHFLAEDPSIAVFSKSQDAAVLSMWRPRQSWHPWISNIYCRLRRYYFQVRHPCNIRVIVRSRWQYKISSKAIRYCSASAGLLLVDWNDMYDEYFAKEREKKRKKNKKRAHEIVKKFCKLEKKTLVIETGALWSSHGDWDIYPPTAADVALAWRYEEHGFEDGFALLERRVRDREIESLFKQLTSAVKEAISSTLRRKSGRSVEGLRN